MSENQLPDAFRITFDIQLADGTSTKGYTDTKNLENIISDLLKEKYPEIKFSSGDFVQYEKIEYADQIIASDSGFVLANEQSYKDKLRMRISRYALEIRENWEKRMQAIPHIYFPAEWKVQVLPPFMGCLARFSVILQDGRMKSVFLDDDCSLGVFSGDGKPYWEVTPVGDDVARCEMNDVDQLLKLIAS